jgi:hypothetical protein
MKANVVTFTQWTNDVKRQFVVNRLDLIAYTLKPKIKGSCLPDINKLPVVAQECDEFNLFYYLEMIPLPTDFLTEVTPKQNRRSHSTTNVVRRSIPCLREYS